MRRIILVLLGLLMAGPAWAQEPSGCDKFRWPLERERALLEHSSPIASGSELAQPLETAVTLPLVRLADAGLPAPPSRSPRAADSVAGFVRAGAVPKPGTYRITLSDNAWIDVFQDGQALKPVRFSGVVGCAGLRKSVKFELTAAPFTIELTGASVSSISLVVTPD